MASAGYVNERPIMECRVRALNDRLWVDMAEVLLISNAGTPRHLGK